MIKIIPAKLEHITALYGEIPSITVRAIAVIDDEKVLGVAGIYHDHGQPIAFTRITDELKKNKRFIIKSWKFFEKNILNSHTFAICDPNLVSAPKFLTHFGFRKIEEIPGEVYLWTR